MQTLYPRALLLQSISSTTLCSISLFRSCSDEPPRKRGHWRREDDNRDIKVSVWWDFENCNVPVGVNVFKIASRITSALRASGIKGPVTITAFGDILQLSRATQEALSATGISLTHVPRSGKNCADRSLLVDLIYWASQNPPPAHLFLISGDGDFSNILHRLRMNNYNILLASNSKDGSPILCNAASVMWPWNGLVRGNSLMGKHVNDPPDGAYGSWYGHYKGSIDDPFVDIEHPACSQPENHPEVDMDPKPRSIPKAVVNQIRQIVNSYPQGIGLSELRLELEKHNVPIDKDYFGYRRFSRFLLSMLNVLKIQSHPSEGRYIVYGLQPKHVNSVKSNLKSLPRVEAADTGGDRDITMELKLNGEPLASDHQPKMEDNPIPDNEFDRGINTGHSAATHEYDSISEKGFFRRLWRTWFGDRDSSGSLDTGKPIMDERASRDSEKHAGESSGSLDAGKPIVDERASGDSEKHDGESNKKSFFFGQILKRWKNWNTSKNDLVHYSSEDDDLFIKTSFWDDIESFFHSPKGSSLISKSKTREEIIKKLQKKGPLALQILKEGQLHRFADILIFEKKWVEEIPSQIFPFKLTLPSKSRCSSPFNNHGSNGLSSIFSGGISRPRVGSLAESELDKKDPISGSDGCHINGIEDSISGSSDNNSSTQKNKKPTKMPRSKIVVDCQKLLVEVLEKNPKGIILGNFKPLFYERYGYDLDYQVLGYPRLSSLLQIIPGVRIKSNYILPAEEARTDSIKGGEEKEEMLNLNPENCKEKRNNPKTYGSEHDSDWDELGPVSEMGVPKISSDPNLGAKPKEETEKPVKSDEYSSLLDSECSDSDSEVPFANGSKKLAEIRRRKEDSSLLRILDSWQRSKDRSQNVDGLVDCSGSNDKEHAESSNVGPDSTFGTTNSGRNLKSQRNYSFVSERVGDEKGKMIDSILSTLNRSQNSKLESQKSL